MIKKLLLTICLIFVTSCAWATDYANLVFNTSVTQDTVGTHTWTARGDITTTGTGCVFGNCATSDGTGDFVDTPDSSDFNCMFGTTTGDCYQHFWACPNSAGSFARMVIHQTDSNNFETHQLNSLAFSSGNRISAAWTPIVTTTSTMANDGTCYLLQTYRSGSAVSVYFNGDEEAHGTVSSTQDRTGTFQVAGTDTGSSFTGLTDDYALSTDNLYNCSTTSDDSGSCDVPTNEYGIFASSRRRLHVKADEKFPDVYQQWSWRDKRGNGYTEKKYSRHYYVGRGQSITGVRG